MDEKSYDELVELLKSHNDPKPRVRGAEEPIADFVTALRQLALYCEYIAMGTSSLRC